MNINFKNKRELTFLGIGILMLIIVVLYTFFAIGFLFRNFDKALDTKSINEAVSSVQFRIKDAEGILK